MKISLLFRIVQIVVSICFAATLFLFFSWDIAVAILLLVVLLTYWVIFFSKRISRKADYPTRSPQDVAKIISSIKSSNLDAATENTTDFRGINPDVFSAFKKNLDAKESGVNISEGKNATVKAPIQKEEDGVILNISGKPKNYVSKVEKSSNHEKTNNYSKSDVQTKSKAQKDEEKSGLFDDIYEQLESEQIKKDHKENLEKAEQKKERKPEPPVAREVIESEDFEIKEEDLKKEAEVILKMSQTSLENGQYKETIVMIDKWMQYHSESNGSLNRAGHQVLFLKGKASFLLEDYASASQVWERLFHEHIKKTDILYLQTLNEVIELFQQNDQLQHAVPFLFTLLNEYRVKGDRLKMDEIYLLIEAGYEQQSDWARLIQTYQNHLSIRKAQSDFEGQLELLDALGKLYFDQDDKAGSRSCYEQSIQIKKEMLERE